MISVSHNENVHTDSKTQPTLTGLFSLSLYLSNSLMCRNCVTRGQGTLFKRSKQVIKVSVIRQLTAARPT